MNIEDKRKLILMLDKHFRKDDPGDVSELIQELGISKSTFHRTVLYMRDELEAPIVFNNKERRYMYSQEGLVILRFVPSSVLDSAYLEMQ